MADGQVYQATQRAMGTVMRHWAFGACADACVRAVCREVTRVEALLSRFLPDSDISRVNRSAGIRSEPVSLDTFEVLSEAFGLSQRFPGCFDVTIAPLVNLWRTGSEPFVEPDAASIRQVLPLVNYRDLALDPGELTAGLAHRGQAVDLGGIGKGYAGDLVVDVYRRYGVSSAFSNLGGNVVTWGTRPDGMPWRVGIQHPREADRLIGCVSVAGRAVVSSGDYQRYAVDGAGKRRHHILNPASGYPAESDLVSVSIVAASATAADALATVLFVAGMEGGLDLLRDYGGAEAVLVDADLRIYVTAGLRDDFQAAEGTWVTVLE